MAKCLNCLYINKVSKTPVNYLSSIVKSFQNEKVSVSLPPNAHSISWGTMTCCWTMDSAEGWSFDLWVSNTSPKPPFTTQQKTDKCC